MFSLKERNQRPAGKAPVRGNSGQFQQGGRIVRQRNQRLHGFSLCPDSAIACHRTDMIGFLKTGQPLGPKAMGSRIISMIRQIDHDRTVQQPSVLQLFQDFPEKSVLIAAEGEIMLQAPFLLLFCQLAEPFLRPPVQIGPVREIILKAFRKLNFLQRIQLQIFFRHDIGIMRPQRSHIHAEGLFVRKLPDLLSGCPYHVLVSEGIFRLSILAVFWETDAHDFSVPSARAFLHIIFLLQPAPVPHVRSPFPSRGRSRFPEVFGKLFKPSVPRALQRADMPFSAVVQMISAFLQILGKQPHVIVQSPRQGIRQIHVVPHPMPGRIQPGEKSGPAGTAMGRRAVGPPEYHSVFRKLFQVRRYRLSERGLHVSPLLIRHENQKIRFHKIGFPLYLLLPHKIIVIHKPSPNAKTNLIS